MRMKLTLASVSGNLILIIKKNVFETYQDHGTSSVFSAA